MSLLIKALDKAQAEKAKVEKTTPDALSMQPAQDAQKDAVSELSLTETPAGKANQIDRQVDAASLLALETLDTDKPQTGLENQNLAKPTSKPVLASTKAHNVEAAKAANVFAAKAHQSYWARNRWFFVLGLALIIGMGLAVYYYLLLNRFQQPTTLPPAVQLSAGSASTPASDAIDPPDTTPIDPLTKLPVSPFHQTTSQPADTKAKSPAGMALAQDLDTEHRHLFRPSTSADNTASNELESQAKSTTSEKRVKPSKPIASDSASITVTQGKAAQAVNPILLSAYNAYNAGNNEDANRLYKQVLQQDTFSIDALLGLGAIATRQNRLADANGWYRKVLEIDPRNTYARSALIQLPTPQNNNTPDEESRLKSMLAVMPEDANLYASLGNFYANQKRWPEAQQAYFDAHRLNASADNAFNLAISLDQLGKTNLALPFYEEALTKATVLKSSNIDTAALTARINAIK